MVISFTAPSRPPATKFVPYPCADVRVEPQFPGGLNDGMRPAGFTVKNTGDKRSFTFYNALVQSGNIYQIGNTVELSTDEEVYIEIPIVYTQTGNNYFVVEVEEQTVDWHYYIGN